MNRLLYTILLAITSVLLSTAQATRPESISNYQAIFIPYYDARGELSIAIRKFNRDYGLYYLSVNPFTFATQIVQARKVDLSRPLLDRITNTPYQRALLVYTGEPYSLQNGGITHAKADVDGVFLTIDMCPSRKPFERNFFNALIKLVKLRHNPVPIAISITGLWLQKHVTEFNWLLEQQAKQRLTITWINHSFSHPYDSAKPLQQNFLLTSNISLRHEILDVEQLLLEHGQIPSVFFRFPGLVADKNLMLFLRELGLIPLGADAWLAKGQKPKPGSIILIHGNGNEPRGIKLLLPQLPRLKLLSLTEVLKGASP